MRRFLLRSVACTRLWGLFPNFPTDSDFYPALQAIARVRAAAPALRYGRYYFRPLSGDGVNFGVSPYAGGPGSVQTVRNATVAEVDGSTGNGPLNAIQVTVQPMEFQILGR